MKKTSLFLVLSLCCCMSSLRAQDSMYEKPQLNLPNFIPTSPNAAALGIYGDIPVGHYTGVADISIPIYEIDLDGKKIPISLSYHASGIKVGQEASIVGLGWVLNAGGVITDNIQGGSNDFRKDASQGYYFDTTYPANPEPSDPRHLLISYRTNELNTTYGRYYDRSFDSQPDLFQFNFASFSGTMFFEKPSNNGNIAKPIIQKETQHLDVSYNTDTEEWIIFDGDGYQYRFKTFEETTSYSNGSTDYEANRLNSNDRRGFTGGNYDVKTAWYLDKIISPKGNTVTFSYTKDQIYTPIFAHEDANYQTGRGGYGAAENFRPFYSHYTYSYSMCEQVIPSSITFPGGSVSFGYGDRLDLESVNASKARKLENIQVSDRNNNPVRTVEFNQSYLGGNTSNTLSARLMLRKVNIDDKEYAFNYHEDALPYKNSYQTDHWGYATNAVQPTGERSFKLSPPIISLDLFIDGLERKSDFHRTRAGSLESIVYPTGGKTVFDYEPNTFQNGFQSEIIKELIANFDYITFDVDEIDEKSELFTITTMTKVKYLITLRSYNNTEQLHPVDLILERMNEDNPDDFQRITRYYLSEQEDPTGDITLDPGTYRVRVINENPLSTELALSWSLYTLKTAVTAVTGQGAGLRIKSIRDFSDAGNYTRKEYIYEHGLFMGYPVYHTEFTVYRDITNTHPGRSWASYINGSSDSYYPFNMSAAGHHVGYSRVTERTLNPAGGVGRIAYGFRNKLNQHEEEEAYTYIRGYPIDPCLDNGLPRYVTYYNEDGHVIKQTEFHYTKDREYSVDGFTTSRLPFYDDTPYNEQMTFYIKYYQLHGERWLLKEQTDTEYYPAGSISQNTVYTYNDKCQLITQSITDSKGKTVTYNTLYPTDITRGVYPQMTAQNLLNYPIEQTKWVDGKLASASLITYSNATNSVQKYLPTCVYKLKNNDALSSFTPFNGSSMDSKYSDPEVRVLQYDHKGNIREFIDAFETRTVYLWGYNFQYPVAIIQDATYDTVSAALGQSTINTIEQKPYLTDSALSSLLAPLYTHALMKNGHVTTYTYKPLVGVSSVTDPSGRSTYYEYDANGRLIAVKDDQGNLIESYDYNYKQ